MALRIQFLSAGLLRHCWQAMRQASSPHYSQFLDACPILSLSAQHPQDWQTRTNPHAFCILELRRYTKPAARTHPFNESVLASARWGVTAGQP